MSILHLWIVSCFIVTILSPLFLNKVFSADYEILNLASNLNVESIGNNISLNDVGYSVRQKMQTTNQALAAYYQEHARFVPCNIGASGWYLSETELADQIGTVYTNWDGTGGTQYQAYYFCDNDTNPTKYNIVVRFTQLPNDIKNVERNFSTGYEAYMVDWNVYPEDNNSADIIFRNLTELDTELDPYILNPAQYITLYPESIYRYTYFTNNNETLYWQGFSACTYAYGSNTISGIESSGSCNSVYADTMRLRKNGIVISDVEVEMSEDRDWSSVFADVDNNTGKVVVSGLVNAPGSKGTHTLYVPKVLDQGEVRICPDAEILNDVSISCENGYNMIAGEEINGVTASLVVISGKMYWKLTGLHGTGAIGISPTHNDLGPAMRVVLRDSESVSTQTDVEVWFDTLQDISSGSIIYLNYEAGANTFLGGSAITTSDVDVTCDPDGLDPLTGTGMLNVTVANADNGVLELHTNSDTCSNWVVVDINGPTNHLTNPNNSGNYSWSVSSDAGGEGIIDDIGATLAYVSNDNDVFVTAFVPSVIDLELYQSNSDNELVDLNRCYLGVLSLNNISSCTYDIGYGTNSSKGVTVSVTSDGALRSGSYNFSNVSDGTVTSGNEEYGFQITDTGTGCNTNVYGTYSSQENGIPVSETSLFYNNILCNGTTAGQSSKHIEVTHRASMSTSTLVGEYSQLVTYTAYTN